MSENRAQQSLRAVHQRLVALHSQFDGPDLFETEDGTTCLVGAVTSRSSIGLVAIIKEPAGLVSETHLASPWARSPGCEEGWVPHAATNPQDMLGYASVAKAIRVITGAARGQLCEFDPELTARVAETLLDQGHMLGSAVLQEALATSYNTKLPLRQHGG